MAEGRRAPQPGPSTRVLRQCGAPPTLGSWAGWAGWAGEAAEAGWAAIRARAVAPLFAARPAGRIGALPALRPGAVLAVHM